MTWAGKSMAQKVEAAVEIPEDPMQIAVYPLAVPYLLNPVGITVLITGWARWPC
jgi:small neutral amino acid transporter SnatA (MarC family)